MFTSTACILYMQQEHSGHPNVTRRYIVSIFFRLFITSAHDVMNKL